MKSVVLSKVCVVQVIKKHKKLAALSPSPKCVHVHNILRTNDDISVSIRNALSTIFPIPSIFFLTVSTRMGFPLGTIMNVTVSTTVFIVAMAVAVYTMLCSPDTIFRKGLSSVRKQEN